MTGYRNVLRMLKTAADAARYDELRGRFGKEFGGDPAYDSGDALRRRERLYRYLVNSQDWNYGLEPDEYYDLIARVVAMRDNALFAKYLPRTGVLRPSKIRNRSHRRALLEALPDDYVEDLPLPGSKEEEMDYMSLGSRVGSAPHEYYSAADADAGRYGKALRRMLAEGRIRTVGDWDKAVRGRAEAPGKIS